MTHNRHYRIQEKYIAYHPIFIVTDDEDETAYILHYQQHKFGHQLVLMDSSGTVLMNIRHIVDRHQTYDIYVVDKNGHHNLLGVFRRIGRPWHHKFLVESVYGEHQIDRMGRLSHHKYEMIHDQQLIAKINAKDDLISIEIVADVDAMKDPFILALVMVQQTL
ncbi:unnamed protein product [Adineta ricciae]|uniref:Uncharacterized protein n=1 Tax=Adineta ricciae TaxID=249248 RepID=A0A815QJF6_ADIRI|nr:unnamed protein product [Adineta ricciae]CAF1462890.1 unnamed protein product [Adineta ricciae]